MALRLQISQEVSLAKLGELVAGGSSVIRSPHAGNIHPANLVLADQGVHLVLHDRAVCMKDTHSHPHAVIRNGKSEIIAPHDVVAAHARVKWLTKSTREHFRKGESVVYGHQRALCAALPHASHELYTEYLARHDQYLLPLLECAAEWFSSHQWFTGLEWFSAQWNRYVDEEGKVDERPVRGWRQVMDRGVYGITHTSSGYLIPPLVTVFLSAVLEAITSGKDEVWHLSGSDMVQYVNHMAEPLEALYDHTVRQFFDWELPSTLTYHMVPSTALRLAVLPHKREALDELVESYLVLVRTRPTWSVRIREAKERDRVIAEIAVERGQILDDLRAAIETVSEIFYRVSEARFTSQHDVCDAGGFYVHPWMCEVPILQVQAAMGILAQLQNGKGE